MADVSGGRNIWRMVRRAEEDEKGDGRNDKEDGGSPDVGGGNLPHYSVAGRYYQHPYESDRPLPVVG